MIVKNLSSIYSGLSLPNAMSILQPSSILVVDDEEDGLRVIEGMLIKENYTLHFASSGVEALKFLGHSTADVILLDVMMSDMDGLEVCHQIKGNPEGKFIPIIMCTALSSKQDLSKCLAAGADDFISKPISAIELRARIRSMLRIKQQHDALKESLQVRDDMANMIVHDLRHPLSAIFLACEILSLLELPQPYRDRVIEKADQIMRSGQRLDSMINDLLLLAKMEAGQLMLHHESIDLCVLGALLLADMQPVADPLCITLARDFPDFNVTISADHVLLYRVLSNLLSNAIKFSPSGSSVILKIEAMSPPHAKIQVIDQGMGIKDEFKQAIFGKFVVGEAINRATQTGLGLTFCKMTIEAHNGTIRVEDNLPQGAIFTIEI